MSITIRRAKLEDARTIAEFAIRLFAQHRNYDSCRFADLASIDGAENFYGSQTKAKNATILVAETKNKIVGFAYLQFEAINYTDLLENVARLHDLYVDETSRRKSVGRKLIEKSIEFAGEFGADKLILSVAAKNELAKDFFAWQGFRETMVEMMLNLTESKDND